MIRRATEADASRIAEILVYNNRVNYFPIFQDVTYSFGQMQVLPVADAFRRDADMLAHTYVYEDVAVKGLLYVAEGEIRKLYVDPFFQSQGVGAALMRFAVAEHGARFVWTLEKNVRAVAFYRRHGFLPTGERALEEGTTEYLLRLERPEPVDRP